MRYKRITIMRSVFKKSYIARTCDDNMFTHTNMYYGTYFVSNVRGRFASTNICKYCVSRAVRTISDTSVTYTVWKGKYALSMK